MGHHRKSCASDPISEGHQAAEGKRTPESSRCLLGPEILFDRVHGKAVQRVAGEGEVEGEPIQVYLKNYRFDPATGAEVETDEPAVRIR
jgi:hypothetical protein